MRIGIYAPNLAAPAPSGVERCIGGLLGALASVPSNHEFVLLSDADFCPISPRWRRVPIPPMGAFARLRFDHGKLARIAREERLDLVHGTKSFLPAGLECPGVLSVYDVIFMRYPRFYPWHWRWYWKRALSRSVERAAAVVCISETTARDVGEFFAASRGKLHAVPPAADPGHFEVSPDDAQEVRESLGARGPYFLYVGNMTLRKNIPVLIEAFSSVRERAGAQLLLAGAADYGTGELRRLLGRPGVRYLERVDDRQLGALYRGALALVYPSQYEGFGLPVLEAMAVGCPAIVADAGALPEVAGDAAIVVPPGSPTELAGAMDRVASDPDLRRRLSARGVERAGAFTWERTAVRTLEIYERAGGRARVETHETAPRP